MTNECVFFVLQMLVCVEGGTRMMGGGGGTRMGGGGTRGRLLHRLSDVLHVSQAMCQGQLWLCM